MPVVEHLVIGQPAQSALVKPTKFRADWAEMAGLGVKFNYVRKYTFDPTPMNLSRMLHEWQSEFSAWEIFDRVSMKYWSAPTMLW